MKNNALLAFYYNTKIFIAKSYLETQVVVVVVVGPVSTGVFVTTK